MLIIPPTPTGFAKKETGEFRLRSCLFAPYRLTCVKAFMSVAITSSKNMHSLAM